jgi:hypothetical protein
LVEGKRTGQVRVNNENEQLSEDVTPRPGLPSPAELPTEYIRIKTTHIKIVLYSSVIISISCLAAVVIRPAEPVLEIAVAISAGWLALAAKFLLAKIDRASGKDS